MCFILWQSEAHGGAVLSILHDRTISLTGCGQLQDVMVFLTQSAAVPYLNMLAKWLYRGIINDPYNEVRYFRFYVEFIWSADL